MYLFSVDFSRMSLLTEQLNIESLYNLPVMNQLLIEHQLINFADLPIKKAYLINCKRNIDFSLFEIFGVKECQLFKELALMDDKERFVAFRNDVYFEAVDLKLVEDINDDLFYLKDKNGFVFGFFGLIGKMKMILSKNMSIEAEFKQSKKNTNCPQKECYFYCKTLNSIKDYKGLLFDILGGKTAYKPPFVAEGVYINGVIPKGDFSIIPPVYLGESVQIESGTVIGPNTIIYNNALISENTSIKNSVLFENVFVSSNCFIDGTVCCDNASIKRNTAVFSESVIGADALIGEDMTLENGSVVNKNVRYDKFSVTATNRKKIFSFDNKFRGLSPDKSALLGSAVGIVFKMPKIIVGCDDSPNSLSLKLAFLSGLIATGCQSIDVGITFKSYMFFALKYCECDYFIYFSELANETNIEIYNSDNKPLNKTECYNLFDFCNKGEFVYNRSDKLKKVRQINGLKRMYIRELTAFSCSNLPYIGNIFCRNEILSRSLKEILNICADKQKKCEDFSLYVNETGTNVNIKFGENLYSQKILKHLVFSFENKEKSIRFFESDLCKKLWKYDSIILVLAVLNIIKFTGKKLDVLIDELPKFYIKSDSINLQYRDSELAEKISEKFRFKHQRGAFDIKCKDSYIRLINSKEKGKIKLFVASKSMAVSEEICNFLIGFLP